MPTNKTSVDLCAVNLGGQNHVCAFFNTMNEGRGASLVLQGEKAIFVEQPVVEGPTFSRRGEPLERRVLDTTGT